MKRNTIRAVSLSAALVPVIGGIIINAISISGMGMLAVALMVVGITMAFKFDFINDIDVLLESGLIYLMGLVLLLLVLYDLFNLSAVIPRIPAFP